MKRVTFSVGVYVLRCVGFSDVVSYIYLMTCPLFCVVAFSILDDMIHAYNNRSYSRVWEERHDSEEARREERWLSGREQLGVGR